MRNSELLSRYFATDLVPGFKAKISSEEEVRGFIKTSFEKVFPKSPDQHFFVIPEGPRRQTYLNMLACHQAAHYEWFLFLDANGNPIGWHMGEMEAPGTFYMRNSGVLPEYQDKGIYSAFVKRFAEYLTELGYERITSHHKPTNRKMLILKLAAGFNIAGMELHENWGSLVKVVKILQEDRLASFCRQFGSKEHIK